MQQVKSDKPTLASVFARFEALALNGQRLELLVKQVNDFEKELIEKNRPYLQQVFSDSVNFELQLQLKYDFVKEKRKAAPRPQKVDKKELMEKIRREGGEVIQQLIDDMDLELI